MRLRNLELRVDLGARVEGVVVVLRTLERARRGGILFIAVVLGKVR